MYINRYREALIDMSDLKMNIASAKGNKITLDDGRVIHDFLSQYGALPFGHSPEFACDALRAFLDKQTPNFVQPNTHPKVKELASLLAKHTNEDLYHYCTLTNSGAETVEAAIKLARIVSGRKKILSLTDSFHGKTFSSLSATGSQRFKTHGIYDPTNYQHVDYRDLDKIHDLLSSGEFAAFIMEPVQGEGGMMVIPPESLKSFITLCKETGTASIFDEIQTGLGRVGAFCLAKRLGLFPDIILFSKALGAGFVPIGAMLYTEKWHSHEFDRKHSSTFAGNVLAATMGIAIIERLTENSDQAIEYVNTVSRHIDQHLERISNRYGQFFSWQGMGLMRGLEFKDERTAVNIFTSYFHRSGNLAYLICGHLLSQYQIFTMPLLSRQCSVRFEPPLDVSLAEVDLFFHALEDICQLIQHGRYDILLASLAGVPLDQLPPPHESFPISTVEGVARKKTAFRPKRKGKRFAFLIHNTTLSDITRTFSHAIKCNYTREQQDAVSQWILDTSTIDYRPELVYEFGVESAHAYAEGMLILSPISHIDMMKLSRREKERLMKDYFDIAKKNNAEIVGLGAYTSVITAGGETMLANPQRLLLTNGNSLTALSTVMSIRAMLPDNPSSLTGCVIGARGSVGRLCTLGLAHMLGKIFLVGRNGTARLLHELAEALLDTATTTQDDVLPGSVLSKLQRWLQKTAVACPDREQQLEALLVAAPALGIEVSNDYPTALAHADFIISATSEGKPFLSAKNVKHDAMIFDMARPFDFIRDDENRVLEGGLVYQPEDVIYSDSNIVDVPRGTHLACLSETITVALERVSAHQSVGKNIDYNHALRIFHLAKKHGFSPLHYPVKRHVQKGTETA